MPSARDRALAILELLAHNPRGLPLTEVADRLAVPRSATHRVLADLKDSGHVRQLREGGDYVLTAKIVSIALAYLEGNGITDIAQPILDELAAESGELVRLAVIDGERLTWVAKAQGARHGLRYDPDAGLEVYLAATANGYAWLSCLSDDAALELVAKQGFKREGFGPTAPRTLTELMVHVHRARERGYGVVHEGYEVGTSAIAAAIRKSPSSDPIGTISIAGPSARMTAARMEELAPRLIASAKALAAASGGSALFNSSGRVAGNLTAAE
jgi:IclR family acetate operon transcriptional repressor